MLNPEWHARLKAIPVLYWLNARFKAWNTTRRWTKLERRYWETAEAWRIPPGTSAMRQTIANRQGKSGFHPVPKKKGDLRIVWIGANEAQDEAGLLRGLHEFGTVHIVRRTDGQYGLELKDDHTTKMQNHQLVIRTVDALHVAQRVDVVIGQCWAQFLPADTFRQISRMGIATANIAMDDRLPEMWNGTNGSLGFKDGLDLVLTSCPDCVLWYAVEGLPATFWPMASDPWLFAPKHKTLAFTFIGNQYGYRTQIIRALEKAGVGPTCYGAGWPNGAIEAHEVARVMATSQMALGIGTVGHTTDLYTLKLRDFDALMAGCCYFTHRNPDLLRYFKEGYHLECYETIPELIQKVKWYRERPEAARVLGERARAECLRAHTWAHRFDKAFRLLGVLEEPSLVRPKEAYA